MRQEQTGGGRREMMMTERLKDWLRLLGKTHRQTKLHWRKPLALGALVLALAAGPALLSFAQTSTVGPPPAGTSLAVPVPQATATPFKILPPFIGLGQGTGVDTFTTCVDIACAGGDACVCETASGNIKGQLIGTGKATFTFELSLNATTAVATGSFGDSLPTQGIATITLPNGTDKIDLLVQGTASDVIGGSISTFTGGYLVTGGAGKFLAAKGAGNMTYSLNFATGPTTLVMNGTLSSK